MSPTTSSSPSPRTSPGRSRAPCTWPAVPPTRPSSPSPPALLREREVGVLTVKKRGSAVEPEELRGQVRPQGPNAATVFLTCVAGAPTMLLGAPAG
nr:hypothetical protein OG781_20140 [Streptomyces sp. NBC_00830]